MSTTPEGAPLRIGFVEPHLDVFGGIRRVIELSNHLVDRGHHVTLYHPAGTPCDWLECRARIRPTEEVMGRRHEILIYNDPNPRDHRTVRRARADLKVFYLLALYERDLLTGFHPGLWLQRRGRVATTRRALRSADLVLANSTWMHTWIRDVLGIESRLVIGGINRDHFHPVEERPPSEGSFRLLCSGDPRERKGTATVLKAVDLARRSHTGLVLETYHGKGIPQSDMARLYGSADLFVDGQRYAGWNNPVAEAMACGLPVVCTDIGGVRDFAFHEQTALLVPPGDVEAMAAAILRTARDPELRRALRENALAHVSRFTWERSAERMEDVLRSALTKVRPSLADRLRGAATQTLGTVRARLLRRGRSFDKYERRGAYHWRLYESGEDPIYRAHVDYIVDRLEPAGTLLDVGCGDGLITAKLADAGFDVTGIDVEPTAIRLARERRPDLEFLCGDLFHVAREFDVVIASEVIEHLPDPDGFLRAIEPLFRRSALITTPNRDYYSDIDPYHCTEYSYHQYVALMKRRFSEVEVGATEHHLYALIQAEPGP